MVSYQCRTCRKRINGRYNLLSDILDEEHKPRKTLADFLWDIAKINNKTEDAKRLPQQICAGCFRKLKNTHLFIVQAQVANTNLFASLHIGKAEFSSVKDLPKKSSNDCLSEDPIDIPIPVEIKEENDGVVMDREEQTPECKDADTSREKSEDGIGEEGETESTHAVKEEMEFEDERIGHAQFCSMDESMAVDPITIIETKEKDKVVNNVGENAKDKDTSDSNAIPLIKPRRGVATRQHTKKEENLKMHMQRQHIHPKQQISDVKFLDMDEGMAVDPITTIGAKENDKAAKNDEENANDTDTSDSDAMPLLKRRSVVTTRRHNKKDQNLKMHMQRQHNDSEQQISRQLDNKLQCDQCSKAFVWPQDLRRHKRIHMPQDGKLKCPYCERKFYRKDNFRAHLKVHGISDKMAATKIRVAENKRQLNRKVTVTKEKSPEFDYKFHCDQCNKGFVWRQDLRRHKRMHLPDDEKLECPYCKWKFYRTDSFQEHLKVHGVLGYMAAAATTAAANKRKVNSKVTSVDPHLCKPNGLKCVQCKICLSKHTKIADLRAHLLEHRSDVSLSQHVTTNSEISLLFYPNETPMSRELLIARMIADITAGQLDRFYSITNELGHELSISGSDTDDTESEADDESSGGYSKSHPRRSTYNCDLCSVAFTRKYKLFAHQASAHSWDEAPYVCQHCQAHFLCDKLLQSHYRHQCKNLLKHYLCRKCPQRFMWMENLKMHYRQMHPDSDDVKKILASSSCDCEVCGRSFPIQKDLARHMLTHNADAPTFPCLWCPRKFFRRKNLNLHIRIHGITSHQLSAAAANIAAGKGPNGKKEIHCRVCNMQFNSISALRTHLRQETSGNLSSHHNYNSPQNYSIMNELGFELDMNDSETDVGDEEEEEATPAKSYKCEKCELVCKRRYQMSQHQLSMHKHEYILKCDKCVFRTVSSDIMDHHMRTQCNNPEKQHQCPQCAYKFMWPENLDIHIKLVHPQIPEQSSEAKTTTNAELAASKAGDKQVFQCDKCERRYNSKNRLIAHIQKLHGHQAEGDDASAKAAANGGKRLPKEKKFICTFCGCAMKFSSNLAVHMRRHKGEKPYKCDYCDNAFPRSSDLARHRRTHTGEKPHNCTVCNKSFSRTYQLSRHMLIHSGERPYKCTFCERSFTQSNDLKLHIRRHTGERPYICNVCGEGFIQGTALRNHRNARGHMADDHPNVNAEETSNSVLQLDKEGNSLIQL